MPWAPRDDSRTAPARCLARGGTTLLWLRDDLRVADHPALTAACDDTEDGGRPLGPRPLGAAVRWWYDRSLAELEDRLAGLGISLVPYERDDEAARAWHQGRAGIDPDGTCVRRWLRRGSRPVAPVAETRRQALAAYEQTAGAARGPTAVRPTRNVAPCRCPRP